MSKEGSGAMLMWMAGVLVGAAQERVGMMAIGGLLTLAALYYFRRHVQS